MARAVERQTPNQKYIRPDYEQLLLHSNVDSASADRLRMFDAFATVNTARLTCRSECSHVYEALGPFAAKTPSYDQNQAFGRARDAELVQTASESGGGSSSSNERESIDGKPLSEPRVWTSAFDAKAVVL